MLRCCNDDDFDEIESIINTAANSYRGVIPGSCWHEPYMSKDDLMLELNAGVNFWGWEESGRLVGVMGVQQVMDAVLVRHAYVRPDMQRNGLGGVLLNKIISMSTGILLVGTWADAYWAIRFYERHGFMQVSTIEKNHLLTKYWHIPQKQKLASVVLRYQ